MSVPRSDLHGDVPVIGPVAVAKTVGATVTQVAAADPVRRGILFHNPGSVAIRVAPSNLTPSIGIGGIVIYPQTEFALYSDGFIQVNCAWSAIADDGSSNPLTVFDFTDGAQVIPPARTTAMNGNIQIASPNGIQVSNLATLSQSVLGSNINRRGILFQNPGTVPISVCPSNLVASIGAGSLVILPGQEKRIFPQGRVRVTCAWNAIASSGSGNFLTILEFL